MSKKYENIEIWKKSRILVSLIYLEFKDSKDYYFRDQINRAALSIMNNVAEGYDRDTDVELRRFLVISRGSCAEVRSMLYVSQDLGLISEDRAVEYLELTREISRMLTGFIKKL